MWRGREEGQGSKARVLPPGSEGLMPGTCTFTPHQLRPLQRWEQLSCPVCAQFPCPPPTPRAVPVKPHSCSTGGAKCAAPLLVLDTRRLFNVSALLLP